MINFQFNTKIDNFKENCTTSYRFRGFREKNLTFLLSRLIAMSRKFAENSKNLFTENRFDFNIITLNAVIVGQK